MNFYFYIYSLIFVVFYVLVVYIVFDRFGFNLFFIYLFSGDANAYHHLQFFNTRL